MAPAANQPDDNLLTADEVMARLLAIDELKHAASTCVLPATRVGGEWRFRSSDLERWIRKQLKGS